MSYRDKIKAAFKPAQPGTPRLDQILEPMTKAEVAARRMAAKQRMDAVIPDRATGREKVAA